MKKIFSAFVLASALLLIHSPWAQATNYYVCDTGGSDSNTGLTMSEPLATFDAGAAKFNSMNAGDAVLFCRGGTFTSSYPRLANFRCLANLRCSLGDYYAPSPASNAPSPTSNAPSPTSNAPRPIINGNVYGALNFQEGGNADRDGGYIVRNLDIRGQGTGFGIFLFNDVNDVLIENVVVDGFGVGVYSAGANTPNPGADRNNDNIELIGSRIINNHGQGWLGGGDNVSIVGNTFDNNGFEAVNLALNHGIYFSDMTESVIEGNTVMRTARSPDGKCGGAPIVGHGTINGLAIRFNTVYEAVGEARQTCWGISVDPGYDKEESFSNIEIAYNKVINVGNISIGCASCVDFRIHHNSIWHEQDFGMTAIKVPVRQEDAVMSDRGSVDNNTIMLIDPNHRGKTGVMIAPNRDITEFDNMVINQ